MTAGGLVSAMGRPTRGQFRRVHDHGCRPRQHRRRRAIEADHDTALAQWRRLVDEPATKRPGPSSMTSPSTPDNRLVARGLEADWEAKLAAVADAAAELARRRAARPRTLTDDERRCLAALSAAPNESACRWRVLAMTGDADCQLRTGDRPSCEKATCIRERSSVTYGMPRRPTTGRSTEAW